MSLSEYSLNQHFQGRTVRLLLLLILGIGLILCVIPTEDMADAATKGQPGKDSTGNKEEDAKVPPAKDVQASEKGKETNPTAEDPPASASAPSQDDSKSPEAIINVAADADSKQPAEQGVADENAEDKMDVENIEVEKKDEAKESNEKDAKPKVPTEPENAGANVEQKMDEDVEQEVSEKEQEAGQISKGDGDNASGAAGKEDETAKEDAKPSAGDDAEEGGKHLDKRHQDDKDGAAAGKKAEPKKTPSMVKTDSQFMKAIDNDEMARPKREDYTFPSDLAGFKLEFNKDGQLRHVETGEPFEFKVREDHSYNQKRYEALGEVITDYVYGLLETETKLHKEYLPLDAKEDEPRSFVFVSEDAMTNPDKLMLLIHGSGVVRAGQWARRLIINECLDYGTQLPFIKKAIEQGYGVMVFNTNLNHVIGEDGKRQHIRGNWSPEDHSEYVWDKLVKTAAAKHIAIVAHSYGGVVTTYLAMSQLQEFQRRVFAIAFTDSVHSLPLQDAPQSTCQFFHKNARNWVSSDLPLNAPIPSNKHDAELVSAGHRKHEWTSWSSFESIFAYFEVMYPKSTPTKEEL